MCTRLFTDKPPIPVKVLDMKSLARLALAFSEGSQILWSLPYRGRSALCFFTAYMYWNGDLPLLAYFIDEKPNKPFLAYRSDGPTGEEWFYVDNIEDTRYRYASIVSVKETPKPFEASLDGEYPRPPKPLMMRVEDLSSIVRVLAPLSMREGTVFPVWHFQDKGEHRIGVVIPFEHYYEADALPIFFYVTSEDPPQGPFLRYSASRHVGEKLEYASNTSDAKYFYAKLVDVDGLPFL
jgi:hypothetical protein